MKQEIMKACRIHGANDLRIDEIPVPQILDPRDVILKVTLATVCSSDVHYARGEMGVHGTQTVGHEFCGEVVEIGKKVTKFKTGDKVLARPAYWCGECDACKLEMYPACTNGGCIGVPNGPEGCFAEYCRVQFAETSLTKIPENLTEEDVIMVGDVLATAYFGLKNGNVMAGDRVVVYGAGPIGMATCILAKTMFGAKQVIAINRRRERLDICLSQGIVDAVVSPVDQDLLQAIMELTEGCGADVTVDTVGSEEVINQSLVFTRCKGVISSVAVVMTPITINWPIVVGKNLTLKSGAQFFEGCDEMLKMIEEGKLDLKWMGTHKSPLNDIIKAYEIFGNQADGCVKWLITPYDYNRIGSDNSESIKFRTQDKK